MKNESDDERGRRPICAARSGCVERGPPIISEEKVPDQERIVFIPTSDSPTCAKNIGGGARV